MGESRKVERNATLVCGPLPLVVPTAPRDTPAFAPVNRVGGFTEPLITYVRTNFMRLSMIW